MRRICILSGASLLLSACGTAPPELPPAFDLTAESSTYGGCGACDDDDPCTLDRCQAGDCLHQRLSGQAAIGDGGRTLVRCEERGDETFACAAGIAGRELCIVDAAGQSTIAACQRLVAAPAEAYGWRLFDCTALCQGAGYDFARGCDGDAGLAEQLSCRCGYHPQCSADAECGACERCLHGRCYGCVDDAGICRC